MFMNNQQNQGQNPNNNISTNKSKQHSSDKWNQLINIQAQQMKEQEEQERIQEKLRLERYRYDLQLSMQYKNSQKGAEAQQDQRIHKQQQDKYKLEDQNRQLKEQQLKIQKEQCLSSNMKQILNSKEKQIFEKQDDMKVAQFNIKRAHEQLEQQKLSQIEKKHKEIEDLKKAFTIQQSYQQQMKQVDKERDIRYAQLEKEKLSQYEQNRQDFFEKIRHGHGQNADIQNFYQNLHQEKTQKEQEFVRNNIEKIQAERQKQAELQEQKKQQLQNQLKKQNHDILQQQIEQKDYSRKLELDEKQQLFNQMQQNLNHQNEIQSKKEETYNKQKHDYITSLKSQIDTNEQRRLNARSMNDVEERLNLLQLKQLNQGGAYVPIVPCLAPNQDYSRKQQIHYAEKSFAVQKAPQVQNQSSLMGQTGGKQRSSSLHQTGAQTLAVKQNNLDNNGVYEKPQSRQNNNNIFGVENPEVNQLQSQKDQINQKLANYGGNNINSNNNNIFSQQSSNNHNMGPIKPVQQQDYNSQFQQLPQQQNQGYLQDRLSKNQAQQDILVKEKEKQLLQQVQQAQKLNAGLDQNNYQQNPQNNNQYVGHNNDRAFVDPRVEERRKQEELLKQYYSQK